MQRLLQKLDQIARLHTAQADFQKSLALLAALKSGEITIDQVVMQPDGWSIAELPPSNVVDEPQAVPVEAPVESTDEPA